MHWLIRDARHGLRILWKHRGHTLVVLLTIGLGVGVNTSVFSLANAFLFSPLPYPAADRLVRIENTWRNREGHWHSVPNFLEYQRRNEVFQETVAYVERGMSLGIDDQLPERLETMEVTPNFFAALSIGPELGRTLVDEDGQPGQERVVVLSHGLWRRRFGEEPGVVGQTVRLDGEPFTVVGVMPAHFDSWRLWGQIDAWKPLAFTPEQKQTRWRFYLESFGSLRPGTTLAQAQANLDTIAAQLASEFPDNNAFHGVRLVPMSRLSDIEPFVLYFLQALVGFVLLIACANVANLQMVRTAGRQRELAIRTALGAGKYRLLRQLLTENLLLALLGGAIGLVWAGWMNDLLAFYLSQDSGLPDTFKLPIDLRVLSFAFCVTVLTGLWFGAVPALQGSRPDLNRTLKEGGGGAMPGQNIGRMRRMLVTAEVASAVVLLVGCGLAARVITKHLNAGPGFRTDHLLLMGISLPATQYPDAARRNSFFQQALRQLEALPGVECAAATTSLPIWKTVQSAGIGLEGQPDDQAKPWAYEARVTPQFFSAFRIPIKEGRAFSDLDRAGAPLVAIINESMARRFWPGESPLGKRFASYDAWREIVGVIGDLGHPGNLEVRSVSPEFYLPVAQEPWHFASLVVRTQTEPTLMVTAVQRALWQIDPDLAVFRLTTGDDALRRAVSGYQLVLALVSVFALLGLALAAVGIYGVVAYVAAQRTNEIGLRMALGADRKHVLHLMLAQGMKPVLHGLGIGVAGSVALALVMASRLAEIRSADPTTWLTTLGILLVTALVACYLPARRATRIDPVTALRHE